MRTDTDHQKLHRLRMRWLESCAALRALSEDWRQLAGHHGRTVPADTVDSEADRQHAYFLKQRITELELETAPLGVLVRNLEAFAAVGQSPTARSGPLTSREVAA